MEEQFVGAGAAEGEEATVSNIPNIRMSALTPTDANIESEIWNPMGVDYFSRNNLFGISPVLAHGFRLIGQEIFNLKPSPPAPLNLSEVPCQIYDGENRKSCWKVNCPFLHENFFEPSIGKVKEPVVPVQKQEKVPISYITNLQEKKIAAVDCIMEVTVAYVKNPWEFYVNCERGWGCCLSDYKSEKTCSRSELEPKLTEELLQDSNFKSLMFPEYIQFQLVAVMRMVADKKIFVRGLVRETTYHQFADYEYVKVQLLDTGEKIRVKRTLICGLPKLYAESPVLANQCKLYRVSPLMNRWTDEASDFFRKLIMGRKCILVVKNSIKVSEEAPPILFEDLDPYEVELRATCAEPRCPKYHEIAKLLARYGHGVLWAKNLFHVQDFSKGECAPS